MEEAPRKRPRLGCRPVPRITFAPTTPFTAEGKVDGPGLTRTISWLSKQGVKSIIAGGTTGEFAAMTASERLGVLEVTRRAFQDGYIFANVSACALDDALDLTHQALSSAAAPDALLILPPYYHKPFTPEQGAKGVEAFFHLYLTHLQAALETLPYKDGQLKPVFLYSFAMHTQQPITPETYGRLCQEFPNLVAGIKASAVSLEEALAYKKAAPQTTVMVGNGRCNLPVLRAGLHVVSGDGVTIAWALVKLLQLVEEGDQQGSDAAQTALLDVWRKEMDKHDEIPANKAAFARIPDIKTDEFLRPPLVRIDEETAKGISLAMSKLREVFDAIKLTTPKTS